MADQVKMCICGRVGVHCPKCGRKPSNYKKSRSMDLSLLMKREIHVYRCIKDEDFTTEDPCNAPRIAGSPSQESQSLVPGSVLYGQAMNEWAQEYALKKKVNINKAFAEAMRQGWNVTAYPLEDDLKAELIEQGLIEPPTEEVKEEITLSEQPTEPVGLDEIIQRMQEESK